MRARAETHVLVRSSVDTRYDQAASPVLVELHLSETFSGDLAGESDVRALQEVPKLSVVASRQHTGASAHRR